MPIELSLVAMITSAHPAIAAFPQNNSHPQWQFWGLFRLNVQRHARWEGQDHQYLHDENRYLQGVLHPLLQKEDRAVGFMSELHETICFFMASALSPR